MKKYIFLLFALTFTLAGCNKVLDKQASFSIIQDADVYKSELLSTGILANLYNRLPHNEFTNNSSTFEYADEVMWSGSGDGLNKQRNIPVAQQTYWDYGFLREIHLFMKNIQASALSDAFKARVIAEARFIRAFFYFEEVKRMGGVPLVTDVLSYSDPKDLPALQVPRAKESDVYDFIKKELDEIAGVLPVAPTADNPILGFQTRANKWTALSLKARAMLHGASVAKYNNASAKPITLSGGEVGMPVSKATEYYTAALDAAQQIIASGQYTLMSNYYAVFNTKGASNTEVIFAKDFKRPEKLNNFTYFNSSPSAKEDNDQGGNSVPVLDIVEAFSYKDGSDGALKYTSGGNPVYYNFPEDIMNNKDNRLAASVLYPSVNAPVFRGKTTSVQTGLIKWNGTKYDTLTSGAPGTKDPATGQFISGIDGPSNVTFISNTGFYFKKFMSDFTGAGSRSTHGDNWWPVFRYAEILLIASEAAFELGNSGVALPLINQVRSTHGGITVPLTTLSLNDFVKERRVELAFEGGGGFRYYDLVRWRMADQVFNGIKLLSALNPYLVYNPSDPSVHLKWVFVKKIATRLADPRFFNANSNYYSEISASVLSANPKLIKNPGQ